MFHALTDNNKVAKIMACPSFLQVMQKSKTTASSC